MGFLGKKIGLLVVIVMPAWLPSQTISGIINIYTAVTNFDACANRIDVASSVGFSVGDAVMLIQMMGAVVDQNNNSGYGTVTSYNNAGNYERAVIYSISGNQITFTKKLAATYDVNGKVQMISIPQYTNVTVSAMLTSAVWNGTTGGVLALEVSGTLSLGANISVDGKGFRGADNVEIVPNSCNAFTSASDYFYPTVAGNWFGALKGEGIAPVIVGKERGRGTNANGGGGGNDHNSGGGGGGNGTAGGLAGRNNDPGFGTCKGFFPGEGGKALTYGTTRMFMGGGGGAGHGNNAQSSDGANGGGIIYIKAGIFEGNNFSVFNRGGIGPSTQFDGAGGGGAGGCIFFNTTNFGVSNWFLFMDGGVGGSVSNSFQNRCLGPGGGGSGGTLLLSGAVIPLTAFFTNAGGACGQSVNSTNGACFNTTNSGQAGSAGNTITFVVLPEGTVNPDPGCGLLPLTWGEVTAVQNEDRIKIGWETWTEDNTATFEIERSPNGESFVEIGEKSAMGQSNQNVDYVFYDAAPIPGASFYRIKQVDQDGASTYSYAVQTYFLHPDNWIKSVYPNPQFSGREITIDVEATEGLEIRYTLFDCFGKEMVSGELAASKISIQTQGYSPGLYFLRLYSGGLSSVRNVLILAE